MKYCQRCLYPENHPLNIILDKEGICSGCRVHEEKDTLDWEERENALIKILGFYRDRPGSSFDCVIPVTGNGDSFFVVDRIKNKYDLNPLLVTYNSHFNTKIGVRNLARLVTELDCDHLSYTVGPDTVKRLTKLAMHKLGDMYWHVLAGSQTFPVQVATRLKIPLIIWGVNGWLDQVGMFSHLDAVEMTKKVRKEHGLRGIDADDLVGADPELTPEDLQAFTYPSDIQLERSRVRGLYLGNFIRWDAQAQVEEMIEKYGYETMPQERTFNTYESTYCWNNAGVHDYIKYLKYGYGKATDHASRDIRLKRITREQGQELVKRYDHHKPRGLNRFLRWLGISEEEFFARIDHHRDEKAWDKTNHGWKLKDNVSNHVSDERIEAARLEDNDHREYQLTELLELAEDFDSHDEDYILLGRSYMDRHNFKAAEG